MLKLIPVLMVVLILVIPLVADEKRGEVDEIFSWVAPDAPGCAVAVAQHGQLVVSRAYGSADLERGVPLSPDSVFDAGSLRKQFVAAAVLLLVEEGRLTLADDVRKHIPELFDYGYVVRLDHLLTHTSGLRDWTGLRNLADGDADAMTLILRQRGLNFAPGEEWSYTNSGYVLLQEVVERTSGMNFSEFVSKRLLEPLGMKATIYSDDLRDVVRNRALAYDKKSGRWKMAMLLDDDRGGGGALLTTAGDLLAWNEGLASGRLGAFVRDKLEEPTKLNNGRTLDYGRGLFLSADVGEKVVWHTGSADGYKALLGRFPEHALAVSILCNSGDGTNMTGFARRILERFVPTSAGKERVTASVAAEAGAGLAGLDLRSRTGVFLNERTGEAMHLVVDDSRLRIAGGPVLMTLSSDRFRNPEGRLTFMSQDEFELRFLSADQIELTSMEGHVTKYRRAERYAPAPSDLQAFAGRYRSDELKTLFHVTAKEGSLAIHLNEQRGRSLEFRPIARDLFQAGRMTVRFRRDREGTVVGLDYANPMIRNVALTRME